MVFEREAQISVGGPAAPPPRLVLVGGVARGDLGAVHGQNRQARLQAWDRSAAGLGAA